ncbi:MAG: hypothetical protein Satyrvirus2_60 [Satyrvirus sp.]|uniref:Uncharacterized protein n=1 Tax=Satyrvirus sp. TaxID=2487771 RepID=A0A3G5AI13_9VIRU|nr:MAG: hypothetical protein Satyrvirus2_60 [Satyrvirus sp.]
MDKFIKLGNEIYNPKYIKEIYCDQKKCYMTIANTRAVSTGSRYETSKEDHRHEYLADTPEYKTLYGHVHKNWVQSIIT